VRPLRRLLGRRAPAPESEEHERLFAAATDADRRIVERAWPYTMTGPARLFALVEAVRYCERRGIQGAFAECGVWRGGSVMAMILTLQELGLSDRDIYLYDTFEGMTKPTEADTSSVARAALPAWEEAERSGDKAWSGLFDPNEVSEERVRRTLLTTGYPEERLHFVRGPVEQTVPGTAPERLALLRLDTDWYESTRHELEHLYPRLAGGGVLILDDYGHWEGARKAVDEYFDGSGAPLLTPVDYACRFAIKD
jgi:hypothetical protein